MKISVIFVLFVAGFFGFGKGQDIPAAFQALLSAYNNEWVLNNSVSGYPDYSFHWESYQWGMEAAILVNYTEGWAAVGWSNVSRMMNSMDSVFLWWDPVSNTGILQDFFTTGHHSFFVDDSQDVYLNNSEQVEGWTIWQFSRAWDTSDTTYDIAIDPNSVNMTFAWTFCSPYLNDSMNADHHTWHYEEWGFSLQNLAKGLDRPQNQEIITESEPSPARQAQRIMKNDKKFNEGSFTRSYDYYLDGYDGVNNVFNFYWQAITDPVNGTLKCAMEAETGDAGYVALGWGPTGRMRDGLDVAIGFFDTDGTPRLEDFMFHGYHAPTDAVNDFVLVSANVSNGWSYFEFDRLFDSGDAAEDYVIDPTDMIIAFAYDNGCRPGGLTGDVNLFGPSHHAWRDYFQTALVQPPFNDVYQYSWSLNNSVSGYPAYNFYWKVPGDGYLYGAVEVNYTEGWAGVGWSPEDRMMNDMDSILMWWDPVSSEAILLDFYTSGHHSFVVDNVSNVMLTNGGQSEGWTFWEFSRQLDTGDDAYDIVIDPYDINITFAWTFCSPYLNDSMKSDHHTWHEELWGFNLMDNTVNTKRASSPPSPASKARPQLAQKASAKRNLLSEFSRQYDWVIPGYDSTDTNVFNFYWQNVTGGTLRAAMEGASGDAGYVAVGWGPTGRMRDGLDVAISFFDVDGTARLEDFMFHGYHAPTDAVNDFTLVQADALDGWSYFEFDRLLDTGDAEDYVIDPMNITLALAYDDGCRPGGITGDVNMFGPSHHAWRDYLATNLIDPTAQEGTGTQASQGNQTEGTQTQASGGTGTEVSGTEASGTSTDEASDASSLLPFSFFVFF